MQTNTITKSEAARRFAVSPSMITKYAQRGMPIEPSGRVDWDKAQHWHRCYIVPELSGSYAARQRQREAQQTASAAAERTTRDLFEALAKNSTRIPELLIRMGLKDVDLAHVAADVFVSLMLCLSDGIKDEAYPDSDETRRPAALSRAVLRLFRFSWKRRRRSPSKVKERTHEKAAQALHAGREGRHHEAASAGEGADLQAL